MIRLFGANGEVPELGSGVKPTHKYETEGYGANSYDPVDVPAQFAGPGRAHLIPPSYIRDCCCAPPSTEGRIFVHWFWDCATGSWLPHPSQNIGFRYENDGFYYFLSDIRTNYIDRSGPASEIWSAYLEYLDSDHYAADWWQVMWSHEDEGVIGSGTDVYGRKSGYYYYRNFLFKAYSPNPPPDIVGDMIYEDDWEAAGKVFYYVPNMQSCRDKIAAGDPLNGCLCDMQELSTDIHAVTIGGLFSSATWPSQSDFPAPPPSPPPEWTDFFCGDCESPVSPPPPTNGNDDDPPPPPPEICQQMWKYEWNCETAEWEEVQAITVPRQVVAGTVLRTGLTKRIFGVIVPCGSSVGAGPGGGSPPPESALQELCPAPTECPCTNWYPASFPCEGLQEVYVVEFEMPFNGTPSSSTDNEFRGTVTVTANSNSGGNCEWVNFIPTIEERSWNTTTSTWGPWEVRDNAFDGVTVRHEESLWEASIALGFGSVGAKKDVGLTPVGSYERDGAGSFPDNSLSLSVS